MAYSTQTDIEKTIPSARLIELTDDSDPPVAVDTDILAEQIAFADALIDSYLRGKHTVPLTTVPPMVRKWSVVLSIYNCYERRIDLAIPETLQTRYDKIIKELELVRDNKIMIDDDGSAANSASYYKSNKTTDSKIFTVADDESGRLDSYFSKSRITPNF